jgi:hypothetical protein
MSETPESEAEQAFIARDHLDTSELTAVNPENFDPGLKVKKYQGDLNDLHSSIAELDTELRGLAHKRDVLEGAEADEVQRQAAAGIIKLEEMLAARYQAGQDMVAAYREWVELPA